MATVKATMVPQPGIMVGMAVVSTATLVAPAARACRRRYRLPMATRSCMAAWLQAGPITTEVEGILGPPGVSTGDRLVCRRRRRRLALISTRPTFRPTIWWTALPRTALVRLESNQPAG